MPPSLDIYLLSKRRDQVSIDRFLDAWTDRAANEDRGDEELMLLPLDASSDAGGVVWEWEPAVSLTNAVRRGLAHPPRAFALYLKPKPGSSPVDGVVLAFTQGGEIVFGVSVDDPHESEERLIMAKGILEHLSHEYEGSVGYIAAEEPPSLFAAQFPPSSSSRLLFSWSRAAV